MVLKTSEHALLVEALRRLTLFNERDLKKPITEAWTGLGTKTEYKSCLDAGLMTYATRPNPGHMTWWKLTEKGSRIVSYWMGAGFSYLSVQRMDYPPDVIPDVITR